MRKLKTIFFTITLLLISAFFSITQAQEEKYFSNSLGSTYTVQNNGDTLVQHNFSIKNLSPNYYISRHGLRISSPDIRSVRVSNNSGEIPAEVTSTANQTNIGITFTDQIVGEGKSRNFTISYINPDLAQIQGHVLEVAIPKQADPSSYDSVTVTLNTPLIYGEPARLTPTNDFSINQRNNQLQLTFSNLNGQGVSAIFGWQQIFDMDFKYFLENNDSQPVLLQVALPPDTPYQRMNYHSIEPKPREIELDEDGNWIATFYLSGNTAQTIQVFASALITLEPNSLIPIPQPQGFHTLPQTFWETNTPTILKLAEQYTTPEEIYDFVTTNLDYAQQIDSIDDLERKGAVEALNNPELAVCQEFSDLFVTMARANGIPARIATGYAYAENSTLRPLSLVTDILHAWPEYWDNENNIWKPVDPTWGNTTGGVDYFNQFDLNHLVFAINGKSSTIPYPAGAYKTNDHQEKSLDITFGEIFLGGQIDIAATILPRETAFSLLPGFYEVVLENKTGMAWYDISFDLTVEESEVRTFSSGQTTTLLPYQSIRVPIFVYNTAGGWPTTDQLALIVNIRGEAVIAKNVEITNAPYFLQYIVKPYVLVILGAGFIILALGAGSLLVLRRKK